MIELAQLQPGAYERHLQRKCHNPFFQPSDKDCSPEAFNAARQRDAEDALQFMRDFEEAVRKAANLQVHEESDIIHDLKESLERLYVRCASLGGDTRKLKDALQKLISVCMQAIIKSAQDDPQALKKLQDEQDARIQYFRLLEFPLVADLLRGDDVIAEDDLIPLLLGEDKDSLNATLELFGETELTAIHAQMLSFSKDHHENTENIQAALTVVAEKIKAEQNDTNIN